MSLHLTEKQTHLPYLYLILLYESEEFAGLTERAYLRNNRFILEYLFSVNNPLSRKVISFINFRQKQKWRSLNKKYWKNYTLKCECDPNA